MLTIGSELEHANTSSLMITLVAHEGYIFTHNYSHSYKIGLFLNYVQILFSYLDAQIQNCLQTLETL